MGAGGAREEVCKASLTPVTISGQERLLTEKKCRGRDGGRADVCSCSTALCGAPTAAASCQGSGLWMGSPQVQRRARVGLKGGLGPILLALSLSSFVRGTEITERGLSGALGGNLAHSGADGKYTSLGHLTKLILLNCH